MDIKFRWFYVRKFIGDVKNVRQERQVFPSANQSSIFVRWLSHCCRRYLLRSKKCHWSRASGVVTTVWRSSMAPTKVRLHSANFVISKRGRMFQPVHHCSFSLSRIIQSTTVAFRLAGCLSMKAPKVGVSRVANSRKYSDFDHDVKPHIGQHGS